MRTANLFRQEGVRAGAVAAAADGQPAAEQAGTGLASRPHLQIAEVHRVEGERVQGERGVPTHHESWIAEQPRITNMCSSVGWFRKLC